MEKTRHFIVDTPVGQLAIYAKHDKTDCAADYRTSRIEITHAGSCSGVH